MNYRHLKYFPEPFLEDLIKDRCIPIIGSGFSKNADLPTNKKMLAWDELGKEIAKQIPGYQYAGALDAISAYCHEYSRTKLIEKLSELLLISSAKPGNVHKSFCELPFEMIVTTNFEFLLEKGYELNSIYCRPIVEEDQLSISNLSQGVSLIKLHGDLHHPKRLIVTEEDYDTFIERNPMVSTFLANLLISKTALFIGYSLDDTDFRQIWQVIGERLGKLRRQAYTLRVNSSQHEIARFERRGIKVINLQGKPEDYSKILFSTFRELKHYWTKGVLKASTVTDEDFLAHLTLPPDENNRLCFFSLPFKYISFYKKYVFPIAQEYGFVPITADEVLAIGDSIRPKISALIDSAEFIIVDIASSFSMMELGMILSRAKSKENILIIQDKETPITIDIVGLESIIREKNPWDNFEELTSKFSIWFSRKSESFKMLVESEPRRLLEKKEYRAAVISSITLLEQKLKERLYVEFEPEQRPYSFLSLLKMADRRKLLRNEEYYKIREYILIRNKLVHSSENVTGSLAEKIVNNINIVIKELKD